MFSRSGITISGASRKNIGALSKPFASKVVAKSEKICGIFIAASCSRRAGRISTKTILSLFGTAATICAKSLSKAFATKTQASQFDKSAEFSASKFSRFKIVDKSSRAFGSPVTISFIGAWELCKYFSRLSAAAKNSSTKEMFSGNFRAALLLCKVFTPSSSLKSFAELSSNFCSAANVEISSSAQISSGTCKSEHCLLIAPATLKNSFGTTKKFFPVGRKFSSYEMRSNTSDKVSAVNSPANVISFAAQGNLTSQAKRIETSSSKTPSTSGNR